MKLYPIAILALAACGGQTEPTSQSTDPLTVNGSQGYFICNANDECWTRTGDASGDLVFSSPYQGLTSQRWVQQNLCSGTFCYPIQYSSPTKPSARIGITTAGQFQMTTTASNWLSFQPMADYIFDNTDVNRVVIGAAPNVLTWEAAVQENASNVWSFQDAPILIVKAPNSSGGVSRYSEYQGNGSVGSHATFVNGSENCAWGIALGFRSCTWSGNAIAGWQGTWSMVPTAIGTVQTALLGPDVGGNVGTYWDAVSVTFKAPPGQLSEGFGEGINSSHAALFQSSPSDTWHLAETSGGTGAMTVMSGDPGGFGENHAFAVPGAGN